MSDIASKRVFISGSRGKVGGNIAAYARRLGWKIFAPSRDELELQNTSAVARYLKEAEIDAVIHCAAKVGGIAANVAAALSFSGTFFHNLSKPVGMEQKLLDSSIAKENGWRPKTSLDVGIKKTIEWFQENISND